MKNLYKFYFKKTGLFVFMFFLSTFAMATLTPPSFSPAAGTYTGLVNVTISSSVGSTTIRYTTDGTKPTASYGTIYTSPVSITQSTTLKAVVYKTNNPGNISTVTTGIYYIKCNAPIFSPVAGTYTNPQTITITSNTSGTTIRYTTDGSTPTQTNGAIYTAPITISTSASLKAIAYKSNMLDSDVTSGMYIIQTEQVATPTFNPAPGTYNTFQNIVISCGTSGSTIRYTTDGSIPSQTNGTIYTSPVAISSTTTLKAIAYHNNMNNSEIASGVYTIQLLQAVAPVFNPQPGTYTTIQQVTISSTTTDATIRYTTNGTAPSSTNGTLYSSPVEISETTTLKAIAYKTGMINSDITAGTYTIQLEQVAQPSFSPAEGIYSSAQDVIIATTTSGATIRYTTDGSTPGTTNGTVYSSPVNISNTTTLKAIAYKTGMLNSEISLGTYTIQSSGLCTVTKSNGGGFSTTISSVSQNLNGTYTIVLTVEHDGCPGPVCKELSHYSIEAIPNTYSNVSVQIISGNMSYGNINMGPNLGSDPFQGFKIDNTSGIGDGQAGIFTVTYTLSSLQAQRTSAKAGTNSQIASFTLQEFQYVFNCGVTNTVATPTFLPTPGTYTSTQTISISTETTGATIRYTTDGSNPSTTSGTIYAGTFEISSSTTIKAIAYKSGMTNSGIATGSYIINLSQVSVPVFSPVEGTYGCEQTITLISETADATIKYTLDGSTPTQTNGITYSAPFTISNTTTVKAIAFKAGMANSTMVTATYAIEQNQVAAPVFSPVAGNYTSAQLVTITSATENVIVKYTIDGTTPSQSNGIVYSEPITISTFTVLKAIVYKDCALDSDVFSGIYNIQSGTGTDNDQDGVADDDDEFPSDPARAFNNYYPAYSYGTLAYEDLWPGKGDYDFNDLVLDYRFNVITNGNNNVVELFGTFVINAFGASFENGFGFQLGDASFNQADLIVTGCELTETYIMLNNNGTEANQSIPTIIVYDNAYKQMQHPGTGIGVNTDPTATYVTPDTLNITITFPTNAYSFNQLNISNFNPFLIVNKTRGREVHLPDYPPTSLVDPSYYGTFDDNSIALQGRYYKTELNLPWAINIYESFAYPIEKTPVLQAYNHFAEWAQSGGTLYPDWYRDLSGYRNMGNIYQKH